MLSNANRLVAIQNPPPVAASTASPKPRSSWTADQLEFAGFAAILLACGLLMIRMLIDPALVRRPLLEPNLSIGGLSFIGSSLFLFLMSNVITSDPELSHQRGEKLGPGYALLNSLPNLPTTPEHEGPVWNSGDDGSDRQWVYNLARALVIFSNLAIVIGIVGSVTGTSITSRPASAVRPCISYFPIRRRWRATSNTPCPLLC